MATLCGATVAQSGTAGLGPELVAARFTPILDGDLAEWQAIEPIRFGRDQIFEGADKWRSNKDLSACLLYTSDAADE